MGAAQQVDVGVFLGLHGVAFAAFRLLPKLDTVRYPLGQCFSPSSTARAAIRAMSSPLAQSSGCVMCVVGTSSHWTGNQPSRFRNTIIPSSSWMTTDGQVAGYYFAECTVVWHGSSVCLVHPRAACPPRL